MPPIRQPSFAGGEFSPRLWSRTDVEKYGSALRRLKNFVVTPEGAAANTAGTRYAGDTKGDAWAWFLPFAFSDTDTLVLVFTDQALRFATRGADGLPGYVESAPGVPYEIATPYAAADLPKLRYAQVGNVVRLACKGYDPYLLTRTSSSPLAFTLAPVSFDVQLPQADYYVRAADLVDADDTHPKKAWSWQITELYRDPAGFVWETAPYKVKYSACYDRADWSPNITYGAGWLVGSGASQYRSLQNNNKNHPTSDGAWWVADGSMGSFTPHLTALPDTLVLYPDRPVNIFIDGSFPPLVGSQFVSRRVYRGRGQVVGYVGEKGLGDFTDTGDVPTFELSPPQGRNPFKVYDENNVLVRTEKPSVVGIQEQRCVFASTLERPGYVFLSGANDYDNFDDHVMLIAEDAFERELAALKREEIRALVPGRVLLAFTNAGEWALSGGAEGDAITALSFAAHERTIRGSSWVEPVKVGDDECLFFPPSGNVVRELTLDTTTRKYSAPDVTIYSKHLFQGRQIVARAWQEEPWSIVWIALDDGTLLSFSYVAEHELKAWAWHDLAGGAVESLCCVREGAEDALYLSVRRTVNGQTRRFIERMESRATVTDAKRGLFLDAAVTYDGAPATRFTGLDHLEGCTVNALADGNVVRGLVVSGGAVDLPAEQLPDGASVVLIGLPYVSELETLDVIQGKGRERVKTVSHVILEYEGSRGGYVGQSFDKKLQEWRQRQVAHGYDAIPLESGDVKIAISSEWNSGGRAVVRQVDPLPVTITAVVREVEYGGA